MKVLFEEKESVGIIKLNNGITNAIDIDLVKDFEKNLNIVEKNFKGLIIIGNEKFFSMGFNLPKLLKLDRKDFENFYIAFNELILKLYTIPIPTISLIEGHAVAGGFIIAIATDYRFAVSDKKMGLNEINLGVPVPLFAIEILERLTDKRTSTNLLFTGELIKTQEALKYKIIDEIFPPEEIQTKAIEKLKSLTNKPRKAFEYTKKLINEPIKEKYKKYQDLDKEIFLESWYSEEAQIILKETAKKF